MSAGVDLSPQVEEDSRPLARTLAVVGSLVISVWVLEQLRQGRTPPWAAAVALVGVGAWIVAVLLPVRWDRARAIAWFVAVACGSLAASTTQVLGYLPALGSVSALIRRPRRTIAAGMISAALSAVLLGISTVLFPAPIPAIGSFAGLVIVVLISFSRRQYWVSQWQARLLLEEKLALEKERADLSALSERSRIARDIHDVLAHSLGGLVLQLDALAALVETGRIDELGERVAAARGFAADGLDEARRAVDALRDPDAAANPSAAIDELVQIHRSLGSEAQLHESGVPGPLDSTAAGALRRAAQEALSNARRHAPGMPTEIELEWRSSRVVFRARTGLTPDSPASAVGGGRGLSGLRERVEAAGGIATAGVEGDDFVVEASVPRPLRVTA